MPLVDKSVRDLLHAFSSGEPTPGGGSAAALSSAIGASLLLMVAGLPKTRHGTDADRDSLAKVVSGLEPIRQSLTDAIDADTGAYDRVTAAYKLPKATDEHKDARTRAIQLALRAATDVPLGVVRLSEAALREAVIVAAHGHRAAASDVGVAVALLRAGARGARLNVEINVGSVSDPAFAADAAADLSRVSEEAARAADAADTRLRDG